MMVVFHRFLFLICFLTTFISCGDRKENYLDVTEKIYSEKQVLFFKSTDGDIDTVMISKIARGRTGAFPTMDHQPSEYLKIEIQHLPTNRWHGITVLEDYGKVKVNDESLLEIHYLKEKMMFHFMFQGGWGDTTFLSNPPDQFKIQLDLTQLVNPDKIIHELTWDSKKGLIGYKVNHSLNYELIPSDKN